MAFEVCPFCDRPVPIIATAIAGRTTNNPDGERVPFCHHCLSQATTYGTVLEHEIEWRDKPVKLKITNDSARTTRRVGTRAPTR